MCYYYSTNYFITFFSSYMTISILKNRNMGNNMGGGTSRAAKIMNINGEFFKLKLPSNVFDVIKDYPNHILLDSQDFLRFNLRAKPLSPQEELKPKKIYLLVELPKFPNKPNNIVTQSPLRRVRSGALVSTQNSSQDLWMMENKVARRSISDLSIKTRSTADDGVGASPVGSTRVKMRLPKAQVQKIMQESGDDDVEVVQKILKLSFQENGAVSREVGDVEDKESGEDFDVERHCKDHVHGLCSPCYSYRRKYKKLTF